MTDRPSKRLRTGDQYSQDLERAIAWRLDPEVSFSDYKLEVSRKGSDSQKDTYHVHKTHLTSGAQISQYFVALFRNAANFAEAASVSRIELEDEAADTFPVFLDFIYSGKLSCDCPEEMIALNHLASYFGNESLEKLSRAFVEKHLGNDCNALRDCILLILKFHQSSLVQVAKQKLLQTYLAEEWMTHEVNPPEFTKVDVGFLLGVLQDWSSLTVARNRWALTTGHTYASKIVAEYVEANKESVSREHFLALTDAKYIPLVGSGCALNLMELEADIVGVRGPDSEATSCLQRRCIFSLVESGAQREKVPLLLCQGSIIARLFICWVLPLVTICTTKLTGRNNLILAYGSRVPTWSP